MAKRLDTEFQAYEFTEEEVISAITFTELQEKHLQNEMSVVAQKKLLVEYDPSLPKADEDFRYQHAFLSGQLAMVKYLLAINKDAKEEAVAVIAEKLRTQAANSQTQTKE